MSYYDIPDDWYHEAPAGTPGWQFAPVPGWGKNPLRAGPYRVGIGALSALGDAYERGSIPCEDDFLPRWAPISDLSGLGKCGQCGDFFCGLGADPSYLETSWGMVALAASGGITLGILFGYAYWGGKKSTAH
jgi:hypothetical protein